MSNKRKKYSAEFKAKVALSAICAFFLAFMNLQALPHPRSMQLFPLFSKVKGGLINLQ